MGQEGELVLQSQIASKIRPQVFLPALKIPLLRVPSPYSLVCSYNPSLAVPLIAVCALLGPGELQTKNVTSLLLVARSVCEELSEECPRGAPLIRAPNVSVL